MTFKVVVAGGGIAGNTFVGCLLQRKDNIKDMDLQIYEINPEGETPPGVNILLNHNGLLALHDNYPSLYDSLIHLPTASPMVNWSARTVDGKILYHLPDVTKNMTKSTSSSSNENDDTPGGGDDDDKNALAVVPALVAQWNQVCVATASQPHVKEHTTFGTKVTQVVLDVDDDENDDSKDPNGNSNDNKKSKLQVRLESTTTKESDGSTKVWWETDVDLVVAADGRYSVLRQQLEPSGEADYGPPCVIDYRIIIEPPPPSGEAADKDEKDVELCPLVSQVLEDHLSPDVPMWRVYNKPDSSSITKQFGTSIGVQAAVSGYARVGLMRLGPQSLGLYGNIALPSGESETETTKATVDPIIQTPDFMAALLTPATDVVDTQDDAETSTTADPLGQLTIDLIRKYGHTAYWARKQQTDTCYSALDGRVLFIGDAAGGIYPSLGQGGNLSMEDAVVAATVFPNVSEIVRLRHNRREFIKRLSQYHARHLCEDSTQFDIEMSQWRGEGDIGKEWHANLRQLWSPPLALRAVTATVESWAPYGQLIGESIDGDVFDPTKNDADLDLSQGRPRLYYMKLQGGRPLRVHCITRHKSVTQCLGALGTSEDFYLVVHRPDVSLSIKGLRAFRIPARHFVKLHRGTWHVGPLWTGNDLDRTFVNLELADTNQVDHDTVDFATLAGWKNTISRKPNGEENITSSCDDDDVPRLVIPVMPVSS